MKDILIRLSVITGAIFLASRLLNGIEIGGIEPALMAAALIILINASIKPIILFLTFPVNLLTLGLFSVTINGGILWFVGVVVEGLKVAGFVPAVTGALIISVLTIFFRELLD